MALPLFGGLGDLLSVAVSWGGNAVAQGAEQVGSSLDYFDNNGSGSGSGSQVPPRRELASSPEWLAYLNALGLEENTFRADIERQRGLVRSDADRQIGDLGPGYEQQRRGISGSLESRGMSRSGEKLRRLS